MCSPRLLISDLYLTWIFSVFMLELHSMNQPEVNPIPPTVKHRNVSEMKLYIWKYHLSAMKKADALYFAHGVCVCVCLIHVFVAQCAVRFPLTCRVTVCLTSKNSTFAPQGCFESSRRSTQWHFSCILVEMSALLLQEYLLLRWRWSSWSSASFIHCMFQDYLKHFPAEEKAFLLLQFF